MLDPKTLFSHLPAGLRDPLVAAYREIAKNYSEGRWEPAELNGGKICEIAYTIIDGATSGKFSRSPSKPRNMVEACKEIEGRPADPSRPGDRSLRIAIPRLLPFLYEIRNNRNVGHVGGDVDPNYSDATVVLASSNWLMAELVRIFHGVSLEDAQAAVDALVERTHPIVWDSGNGLRILDPELDTPEQVLLLLYSNAAWVAIKELQHSIEYQNGTHFRDRILMPLHKSREIEFDQPNSRAKLTPRGAKRVEDEILPKYKGG